MSSEPQKMIARIEAQRNWDRARNAAFFENLTGLLPARSAGLLSFEEVRNRLRLSQKMYRGVHDIPLNQIRGSVGRYQDFTASFLPRNPRLQERWERVNTVALLEGVPPVEVYQVGEAYFVLDGNHRVSIARQSGITHIEAHVWEFATPTGLSGQANLDELLIKEEYAQFLEQTKLDVLRPEAQIIFTAPGRYREIELQIELYREALERIDEEPVSYEDAVTAWYDMIYTPAVQIITQQGVLDRFPGRTEADLFIWTWRYNQELKSNGRPLHLSQVVSDLMSASRGGMVGRLFRAVTRWLNPNTAL